MRRQARVSKSQVCSAVRPSRISPRSRARVALSRAAPPPIRPAVAPRLSSGCPRARPATIDAGSPVSSPSSRLPCVASPPRSAEPFPSRTIKLVIPQPPGGHSDVVGRTLGPKLAEILEQPVVIDNRARGRRHDRGRARGASGARRLYAAAGWIEQSVDRRRPADRARYDPLRDFVPIGSVANVPYALAVRSGLPVSTLAELFAYARAHPGRLNYGSSGVGSTSNLAVEWIKSATGVNIVHVPYRVTAQAVLALLASEIDVVVSDLSILAPHAKAGTLRILAVAGAKRAASAPDIPTVAEQGIPGIRDRRVVRNRGSGRNAGRRRDEALRRAPRGAAVARGPAALRRFGLRNDRRHAGAVRRVHSLRHRALREGYPAGGIAQGTVMTTRPGATANAPRAIDAHQHFWKLARSDYGWLTQDLPKLYRDFLPEHLAPLLKRSAIDTSRRRAGGADGRRDSVFAPACGGDPIIAGVVGWVTLADRRGTTVRSPRAPMNPCSSVVRPMVQDPPDDDWLAHPRLSPAFEAMTAHRLVFDALVLPRHLSRLARVLDGHPDLAVVVDHGAKPPIREGEIDAWRADMAIIAAHPNVTCKLSGLVTEAPADAGLPTLQPYIDALLDLSAPGPLLWGSDWPVVELAGGYERWHQLAREALQSLDPVAPRPCSAAMPNAFTSLHAEATVRAGPPQAHRGAPSGGIERSERGGP